MMNNEAVTCKNCGGTGGGNYCTTCGQKLAVQRLTLHGLLHEVVHYFTHLDKGFGYTVKQLVTHPGTMQKEYVEGKRAALQKPFSMFFLCGTISGLGYYFINVAYNNLYHDNRAGEADFFRHYFVLVQAALLPVYSLLAWLIFYKAKKNFAEILVLMLYSLSLVFLVLILINAVKLIFPNYENRYVEIVFLFFYNSVTNLNFFKEKKWVIVLKTIVLMSLCFAISQVAGEFINDRFFDD